MRAKARLLSAGRLLVPRGLRLPVLLSRSSAGPGAGGSSLFFRARGHLVRLEVVRQGEAPLELRERQGRFDILHDGRVLVRDVQLLSAGFHAPGQAFVNLHNSCRFRCAFCTISSSRPGPSAARWSALIKGALRTGKVQAVALTTGVPSSPSKACRDLGRLVNSIRADFPDTPIGVEPYTVRDSDLLLLRRAGADELKLNIQCASAQIFDKVCPGLDRDGLWRNLDAGTRIFGRGKVCSNLILGLGETDGQVLETVERLAVMGVAANLRPLKVGPQNIGSLTMALGRPPRRPSAARLGKLAAAQKRIFQRYGIDNTSFKTMCHRCTACDLEPFADL